MPLKANPETLSVIYIGIEKRQLIISAIFEQQFVASRKSQFDRACKTQSIDIVEAYDSALSIEQSVEEACFQTYAMLEEVVSAISVNLVKFGFAFAAYIVELRSFVGISAI